MDAEALKFIAALTAGAAQTVNDKTGGIATVLPDSTSLASLEEFADSPRFLRQEYTTERPYDFIKYLIAHASKENHSALYIHPLGAAAMAIIDHGDTPNPQWAHHRAVLALRLTPAYLAAKNICKGAHAQQTLIDFLQDWPTHITAHAEDGKEIELRQAIAAVRRVKISARAESTTGIGNMNQNRTAMESIEASSEAGSLPAYFVMRTPLYVSTEDVDIVLHLSVRAEEGKPPLLALRIVGEETLAENCAYELEKRLIAALKDSLKNIFVGTVERAKP